MGSVSDLCLSDLVVLLNGFEEVRENIRIKFLVSRKNPKTGVIDKPEESIFRVDKSIRVVVGFDDFNIECEKPSQEVVGYSDEVV